MPRYSSTLNRYLRGDTVTVLAAGARTATGASAALEVDGSVASLLLDVTAASGTTPTLNVTIETSYDGTTWTSAGTFTQKTAVSSERKVFSGLDRFVRASYTIAGATPSFTFSISGEAK